MPQTIDMDAIRKLSRSERMALITRIWDTLAEEDAEIPLSEAAKAEICRRVQELKDNPAAGKSHEETLQWLKGRSRR